MVVQQPRKSDTNALSRLRSLFCVFTWKSKKINITKHKSKRAETCALSVMQTDKNFEACHSISAVYHEVRKRKNDGI